MTKPVYTVIDSDQHPQSDQWFVVHYLDSLAADYTVEQIRVFCDS